MNAHKRFLNELRAPMKRYNRKMNDQRRRKAAMPQAESSSAMDSDELMKEQQMMSSTEFIFLINRSSISGLLFLLIAGLSEIFRILCTL